MEKSIFHIFLNSPLGRENLLQTAFLTEQLKPRSLSIFIPTHDQCVMYYDGTVTTLELDPSYIEYHETAQNHAEAVLKQFDLRYDFYEPSSFTGGMIPEIPDEWAIVVCPRAISRKSGRIGLGHIGPKVRSILLHAPFPLFIPAGASKSWNRVVVLFGGSDHGTTAATIADQIALRAKVPLEIHTQLGDATHDQCKSILAKLKIKDRIDRGHVLWRLFDSCTLEENLYNIPHDSLVVVGTGKHSLVQEFLFGTTLEKIQALLPNPLVVCGPKCRRKLVF
jgi:nucleotide-binding universal stress UspA family protein